VDTIIAHRTPRPSIAALALLCAGACTASADPDPIVYAIDDAGGDLGAVVLDAGVLPDPPEDAVPPPMRVAGTGLPCAVEQLLEAHCRTCHGVVPTHGAPISLLTLEDLSAPNSDDPRLSEGEACVQRMKNPADPMPPAPLMSVGAPEVAAFEAWVTGGMVPASCASAELDAGPSLGRDSGFGPGPRTGVGPTPGAEALDGGDPSSSDGASDASSPTDGGIVLASPLDGSPGTTTQDGGPAGDGSSSSGLLCAPCLTNADCGGGGNFCATDSSGTGQVCGVACTSDSDCPTGFDCEPVVDAAQAVIGQNCFPLNQGSCATSSCTDTWADYAGTFVAASCARCHAELSAYDQVLARSATIRSLVATGAMPPSTPLSEAELNRFIRWIDCGLPE
jgi:hypothetical protein